MSRDAPAPKPSPRPRRRPLLTLAGVRLFLPDERTSPPLDWTVHRGERIHVADAAPAYWAALTAVLTARMPPAAGHLEELEPVIVQSDAHLRDTAEPEQTLHALLEVPGTPGHVWLGGRRRTVGVLLERLGLTADVARRPLKALTPRQWQRAWTARFLLSGAHLLVVRDLLAVDDPAVRNVLAQAWPGLAAAVVAGAPASRLPGAVDTVAAFDAGGHFTARPAAAEV